MRMNFTDTSYTFISDNSRKMKFQSTEGNISDVDGNFLMSSNGLWIANATGDTMLNGAGLNPNSFTLSSINQDGLMIPNANMFLPWPGDSAKFTLFHHTGTFNGSYYPAYEILYSSIDMTLDGGLGGVFSKNDTVLQDTLGWGLGACKHANGRDWWIVALKDNSDIIFKFLLTPNGVNLYNFQSLGLQPFPYGNVTQPLFSPNGEKFAFSYAYSQSNQWNHDVRVFDFDRCSGNFSNGQLININDSLPGSGLAYSSNSKFLYATSVLNIYQMNMDSANIQSSVIVVAQNDSFYSPFPPFQTDFKFMYLAANGKIYITSGSSVQDIHEMNYPDSAGTVCDVQQHSVNLGMWNFRTVPNHPNYYLGAIAGSVCDSLTSIQSTIHEIHLNIYPNPNSGNFKINYLLPQNKKGKLEVYDINGRQIYEINLPQWSTLQQISLPEFISSGVYNCVIYSGDERNIKKVIIVKE